MKNIAPDGMPRWVCMQEPPPEASTVEVPDRYGYKGEKGRAAGAAVPGGAVMRAVQAVQHMPSVVAHNGKGNGAAVVVAATGPTVQNAANPVAYVNEWAQKNRKSLTFTEAGQDGAGNFICQCVIDGLQIATGTARNKKQAKGTAAAAALQNLQIC